MTRSTNRVSAVAVALLAVSSVAEGRETRWNKARDAPPSETAATQLEMDEAYLGWSPKPTEAPKPRRDFFGVGLEDRAITENGEDTCGYVNGVETASLYCGASSVCVINSFYSKVGCCPGTSTNCPIVTTCLNANEADLTDSIDYDKTLWCGLAASPSCVKSIYYGDYFSGYTILDCGRIASTDSIYYLPTVLAVSSSSPTTRSTTADESTTPATTPDSADTTSPDSPAITNSDDPVVTPEKKKSNTGAIVGGVVGGIGAVALAGLGFLFWKKRSKKNDDAQAAANSSGVAGFIAGGGGGAGEKPNDSNSTPSPMTNMSSPQPVYAPPPPQSPGVGQYGQQQPGMMMNNGVQMAAVGGAYSQSNPGSPPPQQGAHMPSMYGAPPPGDYGQQQQQQQYQQHNVPPAYPSGVPSQYGNQPVSPGPSSGGYPTPSPMQQQQQQHSGGYGQAWAQPSAAAAGTPPPAGTYPPPQQQQQQQDGQRGFVAELPTEKSHGEVRELA